MAGTPGNGPRDSQSGNRPQGDFAADAEGHRAPEGACESPDEYDCDDLKTDYTDFNGNDGIATGLSVTEHADEEVNVFTAESPTPSREIARMKPIHALMVTYKAMGWTNRKIAKEVGMSESWVSEITRQRWFLDKLEEILNGGIRVAFGKAMSQLSIPAAATVEHILNNPMAKDADRLRAAQIIIEQAYGKPNQKIEVRKEAPDAIRELEDLDEQLAEIRGQLDDMQTGKTGGGNRADLGSGESYTPDE